MANSANRFGDRLCVSGGGWAGIPDVRATADSAFMHGNLSARDDSRIPRLQYAPGLRGVVDLRHRTSSNSPFSSTRNEMREAGR